MTIPCFQCVYAERCFPVLKLAVRIGYECEQGRQKNTRREKEPAFLTEGIADETEAINRTV
jgi:hypothetical protein